MESAKPVTAEGLSAGAAPAGSAAGGSIGPAGRIRVEHGPLAPRGRGSLLPAASSARTSKPRAPARDAGSTFGEAHAAKAAASSRHSKVAPLSGDSKPNVAVVAGPSPSDRR